MVTLNKEAVLAEVKRLGNGLISSVEMKSTWREIE